MPFLNIQDPPKTAKFDNFKQNLPKSKKSSDNFGKIQTSAFTTGQSFAGTYNIDGPLKSCRMPTSGDPMTPDTNKIRLKKAKSKSEEEIMQEQSNVQNVMLGKCMVSL